MRRSLRSWLWRVPVDQEVDEELAFHLEMRTRELVEAGMHPDDARRTARARLGDLAALKQTCVDLGRKRDREMRITQWIDECWHDVLFALRQMRAAPAFTFVAALTLALGIGANSAIFALVDATLLRPLPFRDPDHVVVLVERTQSGSRSGVSPLNLSDWDAGSAVADRDGGVHQRRRRHGDAGRRRLRRDGAAAVGVVGLLRGARGAAARRAAVPAG